VRLRKWRWRRPFVPAAVAVVCLAAVSAVPMTARATVSAAQRPREFVYAISDGPGTVSVIDTATNTVTGTIDLGGRPRGVAITSDGRHAYVTRRGSGGVSVIDTRTNRVTGTISVGGLPESVAITPDGRHAYVTNDAGGTVSVIDTRTNTVTDTLTIGGTLGSVAITDDGTRVYVTSRRKSEPLPPRGFVSVIDATAEHPSVVTTMMAGRSPDDVAFTVDGSRAYVTDRLSDSVYVFDDATGHPHLAKTIKVGDRPFGVAVTVSGSRAYVTNWNSDTVSVIDTASGTVVRTVKVGDAPSAVAVTDDGGRVYVTDQRSGTISVFDAITCATTTTCDATTIALGGPNDLKPNSLAIGSLGQSAVVSLGDSFISGVAGSWRGNAAGGNTAGDNWGTDRAAYDCDAKHSRCEHDAARVYGATTDNGKGCLRADSAEIRSAEVTVTRRIDLACSGAETTHVLPASAGGQWWKGEAPQADRLRHVARRNRVKLVVLNIGGNDMGFRSIIEKCVYAFMLASRFNHCNRTEAGVLDKGLKETKPKVEKVVREIRHVMADAGYALRDYRLVVQPYPNPVPPGKLNRYTQIGYVRYRVGGCPVWNDDSDWVDTTVVPGIARMLGEAARDTNAEFLDVQNLFDGHEVCAKGSRQATSAAHPVPGKESEWARFLDPREVQGGYVDESVHPNYYGQQALGACLTKLFAHRGTEQDHVCANQPGKGPEEVTLRATNRT
jgi:YVTN family beta-propeller protein